MDIRASSRTDRRDGPLHVHLAAPGRTTSWSVRVECSRVKGVGMGKGREMGVGKRFSDWRIRGGAEGS